MFFAKTLLVLAAVSTTVLGHAGVSPPLGVTGAITRATVCYFSLLLTHILMIIFYRSNGPAPPSLAATLH